MSDVVIYLKVDLYIAQWLRHEYDGLPIEFPKNSLENDILELGLTKRPMFASVVGPGEKRVPIAVPNFRSKNVQYNTYLPKKSRDILQACIRKRFVLAFWQDMQKFGNIGKQKQDLVWAWMEAHGIDMTDTNFHTLIKIYQRRRNVYRKQNWRNLKTKSQNDKK